MSGSAPLVTVATLLTLCPVAEVCVGNIAARRAYGRNVRAPKRGASRQNFFARTMEKAQMSLQTRLSLQEVLCNGSMTLAVAAFYHVVPRRTVRQKLIAGIRKHVQQLKLPVPDYVLTAEVIAEHPTPNDYIISVIVGDMRRRWEAEDDPTVCALLGVTIAALEHDGYAVVATLNWLAGNTDQGREILADVLFA